MNFFSTGTDGTTGSGSPVTVSYTQPADKNPILFLAVFIPGTGNNVGTPQWNGTNMTLLDKVQISTVNLFVYFIVNPDTGAQNMTWTVAGGAPSSTYVLASYKNLLQSGQPDAHSSASSGGQIDDTVTVVGSRCLVISCADTVSGGQITGYINVTPRQTHLNGSSQVILALGDVGPVGAGSVTSSYTTSAGGRGVVGSFLADSDTDGDFFEVL